MYILYLPPLPHAVEMRDDLHHRSRPALTAKPTPPTLPPALVPWLPLIRVFFRELIPALEQLQRDLGLQAVNATSGKSSLSLALRRLLAPLSH